MFVRKETGPGSKKRKQRFVGATQGWAKYRTGVMVVAVALEAAGMRVQMRVGVNTA
ncbi:hypothetical protein Vi05172_g7832 [Venturia inaequalis]|nr:hypothetical protein Vi05172_g7832 [Venturia inaequalis]